MVCAGESMKLVVPSLECLPSYVDALRRGLFPDNARGRQAAQEHLEWIAADAEGFLSSLDDPEARGPPFKRMDGELVRRLPSIGRWMWDGEFCGRIGLRWENGTASLPPHVLGHIDYAVVPWKRRQGIGTAALALMLDEARARQLPYVEITTDPDNIASRRTIEANGGVFIELFQKGPAYGGGNGMKFRISLR